MKKAALLAVAVGLGALAAPVQANPLDGSPVVEGNARFHVLKGDLATSTMDMLWTCEALATGGRVLSTGATCELRRDKEVLDRQANASPGHATATAKTVNIPVGPFKICWTAQSHLPSTELIYDVTEPNCIDGP